MALDLSEFIQVLSAMSSLAVIAGVVFVVFQLRQNAKLIEASNRQLEISNRQVEASIQQNRQQVLLSLVDRYTTDAYNFRRRTVREIIRKYSENGWKDYLESNDDFEVRALLNQYESTGFLAKSGIVDVKTLREGLGLVIEYDWNVFSLQLSTMGMYSSALHSPTLNGWPPRSRKPSSPVEKNHQDGTSNPKKPTTVTMIN